MEDQDLLQENEEPAAEEQTSKPESSMAKKIAVVVLALAALGFGYYFLTLADHSFIPGASVSQEEFKDLFSTSQNVYIVMDIRNVNDALSRQNILQCGVDFAGSTGLVGKNAIYLSLDEKGCVATDGYHEAKFCFNELSKGITLYVQEGPGSVAYYNNGMVVSVGRDYAAGLCGIHRK